MYITFGQRDQLSNDPFVIKATAALCMLLEAQRRRAVFAPPPAPRRTIQVSKKDAARFWAKVRKTKSCWIWKAGARGGYGSFSISKSVYRAHRVAYTLHYGPIPDGLAVDHLCCNTRCVNPQHLEAVSDRENSQRAGLRNRKLLPIVQ